MYPLQDIARNTLCSLADTDDAVTFSGYPLREAEHKQTFSTALLDAVQSKPVEVLSNQMDKLQKDMQHFEELYQKSIGIPKQERSVAIWTLYLRTALVNWFVG